MAQARRIVVKIGSRALVAEAPGVRHRQLAQQVVAQTRAGRQVVLVSSGGVALGCQRLGLAGGRPTQVARLQAAAAAGQSQLMRAYEEAFAASSVQVAQVLLTHADLQHRERYLNARAAIEALLELGAVPIINENDTVAVEEIRFGDNDQLAAMVATLVGAELLVLLSSVPGLLDAAGQRVPVVENIGAALDLVRPEASTEGLGGMASKLDAAERATHRGIAVVLADAGDSEVLARILAGEDVGTLCPPSGRRLSSRRHWIAYTLKSRGAVVVDAGAAAALHCGQHSLLSAGVVGVRGDFEAGDALDICDIEGRVLARGLARHGLRHVAQMAGRRSQGSRQTDAVVVHRDDLVML